MWQPPYYQLLIVIIIPQTELAMRGSNGVGLVPWISHIWSRGGCRGAAAELPGSGAPPPGCLLGTSWEPPGCVLGASWEPLGSLLGASVWGLTLGSFLKISNCLRPSRHRAWGTWMPGCLGGFVALLLCCLVAWLLGCFVALLLCCVVALLLGCFVACASHLDALWEPCG